MFVIHIECLMSSIVCCLLLLMASICGRAYSLTFLLDSFVWRFDLIISHINDINCYLEWVNFFPLCFFLYVGFDKSSAVVWKSYCLRFDFACSNFLFWNIDMAYSHWSSYRDLCYIFDFIVLGNRVVYAACHVTSITAVLFTFISSVCKGVEFSNLLGLQTMLRGVQEVCCLPHQMISAIIAVQLQEKLWLRVPQM